MPQSSTEERGFISFTKWAGNGGYSTEYEGRTLHAVKVADPQNKDEKWSVSEVVESGRNHTSEVFIAKGPTRHQAVVRAMDRLDENDPKKPLRDAEMAAWWIKTLTMAYPQAMNFEPVRSGDSVTGEVIGWTFHVDKGSRREFGWVAVDRRRAAALEDYREDAGRALEATVSTSTAEHLALPVQAAAVEKATAAAEPVKEGHVIMALPTERGTRPRHAFEPSVREALTALGKFLPEFHPKRLRLAEVTDRYETRERDTHPAQAWGALVLPQERDATGSRVYGYWLEGGEWHRPGDVAASVPLQVIAERLSQAGFSIESIRDGRVCALHHAPDLEGGEAATEFSDVWVLTNRSGYEVALVESGSDDAMMDLARCLPHVRVTIEHQGDIVRRRLSRWEIEQRRAAGNDPADVAVHHCGERGHQDCGDGMRLAELDPQGRGRLRSAPVNQVEAVGGGTVDLRQLPTYVKGTRLLGIDGKRHTVWVTFWRKVEGTPVETVITTSGEEHRVDRLVEFAGGQRRVETGAHKGDTAAERSPILGWTPLADICPAGHRHIVAAAEALEAFRTGEEEDREKCQESAEEAALWAAAWFFQATGELTVALWRTAVRCAVELHARRFRIGRSHTFDPEPEQNSFFGAGRRTLESRSPEGFGKVLDAARHWTYSLNHPEDTAERTKADQAMRAAAREFADAFGGERKSWITPVRYLAELHAMTLVEEGIARWSRGDH